MTERNQIRLTGIVCLVLGTSVWLIALRIIPYDESKFHAPDWVIMLAGGVFVLGGLAILFQSRQLVVTLLGNLIVISFAVVTAWIALHGESEQFSSNLVLLSHDTNVKIARVVFGACSVMCALILIPGVRHLVALIRQRMQRFG